MRLRYVVLGGLLCLTIVTIYANIEPLKEYFFEDEYYGYYGYDDDIDDQLSDEDWVEEEQDLEEPQNSTPNKSPPPEPTPPDTEPPPVDTSSKIIFGFCMPSTTKRTSIKQVDELPLIDRFMSTMVNTFQNPDPKYAYRIYLGYDQGDPFYDNPTNLEALQTKFKKFYHKFGVTLHPVMCANPGNVVAVWNAAAKAAYEEGCHYLYAVNDDMEFVSADWAPPIERALAASKPLPYFGAAGPEDVNNLRIWTMSCVPRLHYTILGWYFPPAFANWHSDDWITQVYPSEHAFWLRSAVQVKNTNVHGTRYDVVQGGHILGPELTNSRRKIAEFFESCVADPSQDKCPRDAEPGAFQELATFYRARS